MPTPIVTTTYYGVIKSVTSFSYPSSGGYTPPRQYDVVVIVDGTSNEVKVRTESPHFKEGQSVSFTSTTGPVGTLVAGLT